MNRTSQVTTPTLLSRLGGTTGHASREENQELLTKYQKATGALRDRLADMLIRRNMPLIISRLRGYFIRHPEDRDDIIQMGCIGLIRAADKFDLESGNSFSTYAVPHILMDVRRYRADYGELRLPYHVYCKQKLVLRAKSEGWKESDGWDAFRRIMESHGTKEALALTEDQLSSMLRIPAMIQHEQYSYNDEGEYRNFLDRVVDEIPGMLDNNVFEDFSQGRRVFSLSKLVDETLDERESEIIKHRFGLVDCEEMTLEELGVEFNVSRERIRQIEKGALEKLRKKAGVRQLDRADF